MPKKKQGTAKSAKKKRSSKKKAAPPGSPGAWTAGEEIRRPRSFYGNVDGSTSDLPWSSGGSGSGSSDEGSTAPPGMLGSPWQSSAPWHTAATKVLWINPIGTPAFDASALSVLEHAKRGDTRVDIVSLPTDRPRHLSSHAYEGLVVADIIKITQASAKEYDAIVIGCFYDTGLREARDVSGSAVVVAPCQAACDLALQLGNTFSVLVAGKKEVPKMKETIRKYGRDHAMASMRPLGIAVHEFQADRARTQAALMAEARAAVHEDGAEVIVLGCTAEYGFHAAMQAELGVPVIDAMCACFPTAFSLLRKQPADCCPCAAAGLRRSRPRSTWWSWCSASAGPRAGAAAAPRHPSPSSRSGGSSTRPLRSAITCAADERGRRARSRSRLRRSRWPVPTATGARYTRTISRSTAGGAAAASCTTGAP